MRGTAAAIVLMGALIATVAMGGTMREAEENGLDYFVFIYRRGPAWSEEAAPLQQEGLTGHFRRMQKLEDAGILVMGGPFKDLSGALGIFHAASASAAEALVAEDPVITAGTMVAEVRPWHPSVVGCVRERAWSPAP